MKRKKTDVVIIGSGTAGMTAMRAALKYTKRVLLIEGGQFGTTCARIGCMPSKLLIAAAERAHHYKNAHLFGVHHKEKPRIDGLQVMKRVQSERDRFVGFVLDTIKNYNPENIIEGFARFKNANTLLVNDDFEVTASSIVIATGSTPVIPGKFKDLNEHLLTNENIFEMPDLPKSVAVIGSGVIALELSQALHRLGVKVAILARSGRIGTLTDPLIQKYAADILSRELDITNQTNISNLSVGDSGVEIEFSSDDDSTKRREIFEKVLVAAGREANLKHLDLQNSGLELDQKGIPIFNPDTTQCGESHIFLAGDVNNNRPLLHEASDEGFIAGTNAGQYPKITSIKRRSPIEIMFSDPEIALVGDKYRNLDQNKTVIGEVSFENQGRSRVMLINKGYLRIYADKVSQRFMGAEMIGPRAEHLAHLLAWSHQQQMTIPQMLEMPFYHPVIEEGLRTALRDTNSKFE